MINQQTFAAVLPYAAMLDSASISIDAVPRTELAALVNSSNSTFFHRERGSDGLMCVNSQELPLYTQTREHAETFSQIEQTIIPMVKEHLRYAQAVVNPVVVALHDRVEEVSKYFVTNRITELEVRRESIATPLGVSALVNVVNTFCPQETITISPLLIFPAQTPLQLLELMKVGNEEIDTMLTKWFHSQPEWIFLKAWQSFFLSMKADHAKFGTYTMGDVVWNSTEGTTVAIALFMWCNRLYDSQEAPLEGMDYSRGTSAKTYSDFLTDMRAQAARRICTILELESMRSKSGSLVRRFDNDRKVIFVDDKVYMDWLEKNDGNNEILYGLLISGDRVTMVADINASKERYLKIYNDYSSMAKHAQNTDWGTSMRRTLLDCLYEQIKLNITEPSQRNMALEAGRKAIYELGGARLRNDLSDVCLELVHQLIFPGTAALVILRGINTAKQENPGLDVREAAHVSTLRYIASYVTSMLSVSNAALS